MSFKEKYFCECCTLIKVETLMMCGQPDEIPLDWVKWTEVVNLKVGINNYEEARSSIGR